MCDAVSARSFAVVGGALPRRGAALARGRATQQSGVLHRECNTPRVLPMPQLCGAGGGAQGARQCVRARLRRVPGTAGEL